MVNVGVHVRTSVQRSTSVERPAFSVAARSGLSTVLSSKPTTITVVVIVSIIVRRHPARYLKGLGADGFELQRAVACSGLAFPEGCSTSRCCGCSMAYLTALEEVCRRRSAVIEFGISSSVVSGSWRTGGLSLGASGVTYQWP